MSDPNVIEQPEARPVVACSDLLGGWTKTPPTIPGHYWITFGGDLRMTVLEVEMWRGEMQCYYHNDWRPLKDADYWQEVVWWPAQIQPPNDQAHPQPGAAVVGAQRNT